MIRTFRSDHIRGGAVRLENCNGYWENELLHIYLGKSILDEENEEMINNFVEAGTPWILYREDEMGNTMVKAFKKFRDAIDYIIINQEDMGKDRNYFPNGSYMEYM